MNWLAAPPESPAPLQGAKLFYLSGLIHGHYPKVEVHNLGRFISVMKLHPRDWQSGHAHVLCDRLEDLTSPEAIQKNSKCDRSISVYGYVRGTNLKPDSAIHIPGLCLLYHVTKSCDFH